MLAAKRRKSIIRGLGCKCAVHAEGRPSLLYQSKRERMGIEGNILFLFEGAYYYTIQPMVTWSGHRGGSGTHADVDGPVKDGKKYRQGVSSFPRAWLESKKRKGRSGRGFDCIPPVRTATDGRDRPSAAPTRWSHRSVGSKARGGPCTRALMGLPGRAAGWHDWVIIRAFQPRPSTALDVRRGEPGAQDPGAHAP
jgi:hypothetical protein